MPGTQEEREPLMEAPGAASPWERLRAAAVAPRRLGSHGKGINLSNNFLERSQVPVQRTEANPLNTCIKGKTGGGGPTLTSPRGGVAWACGGLGS